MGVSVLLKFIASTICSFREGRDSVAGMCANINYNVCKELSSPHLIPLFSNTKRRFYYSSLKDGELSQRLMEIITKMELEVIIPILKDDVIQGIIYQLALNFLPFCFEFDES